MEQDLVFSKFVNEELTLKEMLGEEFPDDFDRYADLEDQLTCATTLASPYSRKTSSENTVNLPPTATRDLTKGYRKPPEKIKAAGKSKETSFDASDGTYQLIGQTGEDWIDYDFDKAPCRANGACGFTVYWEVGNQRKWNAGWPQFRRDMEKFKEKCPSDIVMKFENDPESIGIYCKKQPRDSQFDIKRQLDSIDWISMTEGSKAVQVVMLALLRAKALTGDGLKLGCDGSWQRDEACKSLARMYTLLWPQPEDALPENPFKHDPDFYFAQTHGKGQPALFYNRPPPNPFMYLTSANQFLRIGYHTGRLEEYIKRVFG